MTESRAGSIGPVFSMIEFLANSSADKLRSVHEIPRHDVLQHIDEMCATASYLSIAHNCESLSTLPVLQLRAIWQASRIVRLDIKADLSLVAFAKRAGEHRDAQKCLLVIALTAQIVVLVHGAL